jgi:serine protease AprX
LLWRNDGDAVVRRTPIVKGKRSKQLRASWVLAVACGIALMPWAPRAAEMTGGERKLDLALKRAVREAARSDAQGRARVIIRTAHAKRSTVTGKLRQHGHAVDDEHELIDAVTSEVHIGDLEALAADPDILSISSDVPVHADAVTFDLSGQSERESLLATLGVNLEKPPAGDHVTIAVVDSGLEMNDDLGGSRAERFYDFVAGGGHQEAYDDYGHGTHVAGLIAGTGQLSDREFDAPGSDGKLHKIHKKLYGGIAPKVRIISLKVLDGNGQGLTSSVIDAIQFTVENRNKLGIDVLNLSLGHPVLEPASTDPLVQAVEAAARAGIVVVASAGNYGLNPTTGEPGYAGITSPGNAPSAITVGAVDTKGTVARDDDTIPGYSSRGPTWYDGLAKPDLVAPGHRLVSDAAPDSTLFRNRPQARVAGKDGRQDYLRLSGTSMSAAVTSGVVALMIEASRNASGTAPPPDAIKALLAYTALPLAGADALTQGRGAINPSGAVALMLALADTGWPAGDFITPLTPATTVAGETWVWGQSFDGGDTVVWGNDGEPRWAQTVVWGNIDWGDTVVWGNADTIGWGDTVVWGNADGWGDTVVWGNTNGIR